MPGANFSASPRCTTTTRLLYLRPITKQHQGTHSAQSRERPTCSQQGPPGNHPATTTQDLHPPYALIWALTTHPPRVEPGCMSQPTIVVAILSVPNLNTKIHTQSVLWCPNIQFPLAQGPRYRRKLLPKKLYLHGLIRC